MSVLTPLSAPAPYATAQDLINRYDQEDIAQWASDSRLPLSVSAILNTASPNLKVLAALQDASGDIEAACMMSQKYQPQDLGALTGNSLSLLKRLCCELAIGYLFERRLRRGDEDPPAAYTRGLETLERLRKGEWVFGFVEAAQAGLPFAHVESAFDVDSRNLTTRQAERYFSRRSNRYCPFGPASNQASPQEGGTGLIGGAPGFG